MASLDSLPADERAVLELVLQRGRSYDEIARLLSIDRGAVRARALAALDGLGPPTDVPPERRALITDYLLGQLPEGVTEDMRGGLVESPGERAWARALSSELAPLASGPLPEIPGEDSAAAPTASAPPPAAVAPERDESPAPEPPEAPPPRSSRVGGMVVLAGGALVVAAIVAVVVIVSSGSSSKPSTDTTAAASVSTPAASTSTPAASGSSTSSAAASSTSSTTAKVVAQINLLPPTARGKIAGIAEVLKEGAANGIAIVAQDVPPNTTHPPNAYAVWLYNSPKDAHILGFVNPGVGKTGRLSAASALPANASHFKQLIITLETVASPKTPGKTILQGALTGL